MSEKGADIQSEPEVVQPARVFAPKKCKAEGCESIFTPTVGYQTYCDSCRSDRAKTKRSREKAKRKAAAELDRANQITRQEFWAQNRRSLKKAERDRLEQRTEEMLFLYGVMDDYVNGTDGTTPQDLQDTIAEVAAEVAQHGLCDLNVALIEWWKPWEKDFYDAVVANAGATETFVRFGFIDAIPSNVYHRFASKFMQKETTNPTVKAEWVVLTCASPDCQRGLPAMPTELAREFAAKGVKPLCYLCIDSERKSVAQATVIPSHAGVYDKFGRIGHWRKEEV